jgi:hypothetical protein
MRGMPFEVLGKRHIGELFDNKLKVLIRTSPVKPRFITISANGITFLTSSRSHAQCRTCPGALPQ